MAPDNIFRSYEVKLSVQENVITCNPSPQANSPERCPNHSFELVSFRTEPSETIHRSSTQVYKLLNQNTFCLKEAVCGK